MKRVLHTIVSWLMASQPQQNAYPAYAKVPYDPLNANSARLRINPVKGIVMIILFTLLLVHTVSGQTQTVILTSGSSWTVPSNVYSITVECWGGGGGAGTATNAGRASGGGGGGAYAKKTFTVVPATNYTYAIGAAGSGGTGTKNGGDTYFNTVTYVMARWYK